MPSGKRSIISSSRRRLSTAQNGSLAVPGGRDLARLINRLLDYSFTVKVASRDCHPLDHISFPTQHNPPDNEPFVSRVEISNPSNPNEKGKLAIWPVHCVEGTDGANIVPEIKASKLDLIVDKGRDRRVEMYSAFADMFGNKSTESASVDLAAYLKNKGITHTYILGLTGDCCVKDTALGSVKEGFQTFVFRDGVKSVDEGVDGWGAARKEMEAAGVKIILSNDSSLDKIKR